MKIKKCHILAKLIWLLVLAIFVPSFILNFLMAAVWAQGPINPPAGNEWTPNDTILSAFMYKSSTDQWSNEVDGEWESRRDFEEGETPPNEREYGAFTVANMNDTDSDGLIDFLDQSVKASNNESEDETDLFLLKVKIPAGWDVNKNSQGTLDASLGSGICFWTDCTKENPFQGTGCCTSIDFRLLGVFANQEIYVWVEVTLPSATISDKYVEFQHTQDDGDNGTFKENDIVDVTGIWCYGSARFERSADKIIAVDKPAKKVTINKGAENYSVDDKIVLFDDDNTNGWNPPYGTATQAEQLKIDAIDYPTPNTVILTLNCAALPTWLEANDYLEPGLSANANGPEINGTFRITGFYAIGNQRDLTKGSWGIEHEFVVTPSEIAWRTMSIGEVAKFDVTRQVERHARFTPLNGPPDPLSSKYFPIGDELPNDDLNNNDEDNEPYYVPLHDSIFSWDAPGPIRLACTCDERYEYRGNFKEFVRVDLSGVQPAGDTNDRGSRCSSHMKWRTAIDLEPNLDRPTGLIFGQYYWKKKNPPAPLADENGDPIDNNDIKSGEWIHPGVPNRTDDLDF